MYTYSVVEGAHRRQQKTEQMRRWRAANPEKARESRLRSQAKRKEEHGEEDRARSRSYARRRRAQDPSKHAAEMREWRAKNPERTRELARESAGRAKERDPEGFRRKARDRSLRAKYGISEDDFNRKVDEQGGLCACCGEAKPVVVDHCHSSGDTRDILCQRCNVRLGALESGPWLFKGLAYLKRHGADVPLRYIKE